MPGMFDIYRNQLPVSALWYLRNKTNKTESVTFKSFNPSRGKLTPGEDESGEKFKLHLHLSRSVTVSQIADSYNSTKTLFRL